MQTQQSNRSDSGGGGVDIRCPRNGGDGRWHLTVLAMDEDETTASGVRWTRRWTSARRWRGNGDEYCDRRRRRRGTNGGVRRRCQAFDGGSCVQWRQLRSWRWQRSWLRRCPTARRRQDGGGKEEDSDTTIKFRRRHAAMATGGSSGAVVAALSAAVVACVYGGDGRLWRRRKEQR